MKRASKRIPVTSEQLPPVIKSKHSANHKYVSLSKIIQLKRKGISEHQIAKLLDCSQSNINQRLDNVEIEDYIDHEDNPKQNLRILQKRIVNSLSTTDIKNMKGYEKVKSIAILEDKLETKADHSVNVLNINVIVDEIDKRIRKQDIQDIVVEPIVKQEISNDDA